MKRSFLNTDILCGSGLHSNSQPHSMSSMCGSGLHSNSPPHNMSSMCGSGLHSKSLPHSLLVKSFRQMWELNPDPSDHEPSTLPLDYITNSKLTLYSLKLIELFLFECLLYFCTSDFCSLYKDRRIMGAIIMTSNKYSEKNLPSQQCFIKF